MSGTLIASATFDHGQIQNEVENYEHLGEELLVHEAKS